MILGIDYGRVKIGLARADGSLAEPWKVLKISSPNEALTQLQKIIDTEKPEKIVIGISENKMGEEQEEFALNLETKTGIQIIRHDEGLSTYDAQQKAHSAGIHGKKLQNLEDAFAAALVLQSYLDGTN